MFRVVGGKGAYAAVAAASAAAAVVVVMVLVVVAWLGFRRIDFFSLPHLEALNDLSHCKGLLE